MATQPVAGAARPSTRELTDVITRLRRTLRTSIRTDYPWETLTMAQIELLMAVQDHQPARVGQLAVVLRLAQSTVSGLVQQLVEAGFVDRSPDLKDRRVAVITLTTAGSAQIHDWDNAHQRRLATALGQLSEVDQLAIDQVVPALARLVDRLAQDSTSGNAARDHPTVVR